MEKCVNPRPKLSQHPHPAMKWTLLVGFVAVLVLGTPFKASAGTPTVKPPTGPSSGGYFTGTYTFETYINCQSGLSFQSTYSNSLEGTNTFSFDSANDGSLLVRINGGGALILYSCGDPTPTSLVVSYSVSRDTIDPSVGISSPANGTSITASQIEIAVSAGDSTSGIGSVAINGQNASFSAGLWRKTIGLSLGNNTITAVASDNAGHSSSSQITVNRQPGPTPSPTPSPPPPSGGGKTTPKPPAPGISTPVPSPASVATPTPQPIASSEPSPSIIPVAPTKPSATPQIKKEPESVPEAAYNWINQLWKLLFALPLLAIFGVLFGVASIRHELFHLVNSLRIRSNPYIFKIKNKLRGIGHDQPRGKHFIPKRHTGKVVAHHHTSYPALAFLLLCTGVLSGAVSWSGNASNSTLSFTVLGPPPTTAAYIGSPVTGDTVTTQAISISGTCPLGVVVEVYRDGGFAGSGFCNASGLFDILISLNDGSNSLVAKVVDGLGQYGPDSNTVLVTYNAPPPPPSPSPSPSPSVSPTPAPAPGTSTSPKPSPSKTPTTRSRTSKTPAPPPFAPFTLDSDQHYYQGVSPGEAIKWQLKISGGSTPFSINWNWGDGSNDLVVATDRASTSPSHIYKEPGYYTVTVKAKDATGRTALLQMLVVVNGAMVQAPIQSAPDNGIMFPIWPLLAGAALLVTSFWLGEKTYKQQHPRLTPTT